MAENLPLSNPNIGDTGSNMPVEALLSLTSARDLETLLNRALTVANRLLKAEAGSILFQGNMPRTQRSGPFRPEALKRIEHWENVISRRLLDTVWEVPSEALPISTSKVADSGLVLINVPLLQDNAVVGSLSLVLPPNTQVTEAHRLLLGQLARSVGQTASLVADLELAQRRLNQIGVFYQVGQALVTTFDINQLLSDTMQLAANVIDAGAASLMLIDEARQELVFEVSHGSRSKMLRQQRIPLDEGIAGWVARHGHPVIANNARTDPRFSHRVDVRTGFLTQSIAAVPLKIKGRIIGVLEVLNKYAGGGFDHEDIQLMNSIAAQAAIAIENARLYQQVREERDHIIKAQENVRRELARNLHDGPIQLLSAISMSLDHLERLNDIKPVAVRNEIDALRNLVHNAIRDTRQVLFELRPVVLETQGLVVALKQSLEQFQANENFTVHFEADESLHLEPRVAGTIFSIVQEALTNIKRHAEARNVWLSFQQKDERLIVTIRDDGRGFDLSQKDDERDNFGLLTMQERAQLIDAELQIESKTESPNRGTMVQLVMPLNEAKNSPQSEA